MEGHEHSADFWTEVWSITLDPAHMVAELVSAVIIDVVVIYLMYNLVFKKYILPKWRNRLHAEIDAEHGYEHDEKGQVHKTSDNEKQNNS